MTTRLTRDLAKFVSSLRFEHLPQAALAPIRVAFTDTLGVAIAGAADPAPRLLASVVAPRGDEATLLGGYGRASALDAAWINGTAAHALDYDDVSQRGIGHASAVLVPAILAEAEALGASGKQMMAAYAAGYETIAELARRDADIGRYHEKGWHPTPVFGAIAAAAASASLRGLTPEQCTNAIAVSASHSAGLISNVGTMTKPLHAGHAAHAGVAAARLAAAGFTAAVDALEHVPGFFTAFSHGGRIDLESRVAAGSEWQICGNNRISVKKYPLCYCTHRSIDGMFDILHAHPIRPDDVERITVSISRRNAVILRNHEPQTGLEAKFSIEFAVVAPLIARRAGLSELTDGFVSRADVQALMKRVTVTPDDRDNPTRPGYAVHDRVIVETRDGRRLDSGPITNARGDHERPLQQQDVWEKFEECLKAGSARAPARELFEMLMSLEQLEEVRQLIERLEPAPRQRAA